MAEEIAILLPGASVVKAFNTVLGRRLAEPVVDGMRLDGFYAGDDARAKAAVAELLAAMGFRPLDFGPLRAARSLEHLGFLNVSLNVRHGWSWSSPSARSTALPTPRTEPRRGGGAMRQSAALRGLTRGRHRTAAALRAFSHCAIGVPFAEPATGQAPLHEGRIPRVSHRAEAEPAPAAFPQVRGRL